jgi:2-polyprenyl-3-methyl-5-hydroxy-6-metoxy-1,4-benzoquinol methylase
MNKPLQFADFDRIYQDSVRFVFEHWNADMQRELARHCYGWRPEVFDFRSYLRLSSLRFYKAYSAFAGLGHGQRICDIGGFWGVFPMTLKAIGFEVAMTESLSYYGASFKELFHRIEQSGLTVFDYDPFRPGVHLGETFDGVSVMAVLEHYPHSLKPLMENLTLLMKPKGKLYLEVPNIAYWPKRVGLMLGRSPQAQLRDIYRSDVPFIGHHHEFTISELRELASMSGLSIVSESFYNYSDAGSPKYKTLLRNPVRSLAHLLLRDSRECLAILCEQSNQPRP